MRWLSPLITRLHAIGWPGDGWNWIPISVGIGERACGRVHVSTLMVAGDQLDIDAFGSFEMRVGRPQRPDANDNNGQSSGNATLGESLFVAAPR